MAMVDAALTGTDEYDLRGKRVWVAGHRGMVGSAICRRLAAEHCEILKVEREIVDLRRQSEVEQWMRQVRPQAIFLAAARVGGIEANRSRPADFCYDNLMIEANVIHGAFATRVEKLLFLGSTCIYPRDAPQPIPETALLSGPLEPTNAWYAIAKIAGIKLCQAYRAQHGCDFITAQPTNLYGPGDNYETRSSHVLPALIRKAHAARSSGAELLPVWGSGRPRREFCHVDDCADAAIFLMKRYSGEMPVNVGTGQEVTIRELAEIVSQIVGFKGAIRFDASMPDGTPRKLADTTRLAQLGWKPRISLRDGIIRTYADLCEAVATGGDPFDTRSARRHVRTTASETGYHVIAD